jgi:biotin carboxylase
MVNVVFAAPFFLEATTRFVATVAKLPGVRLGLVSQDTLESLPPVLRSALVGHYRVRDAMDAEELARGVAHVGKQMGGIDRLLGTLEHLQVQLAQVRDRLGIEGMGLAAARNFRDKSRMKEVMRSAGLPCARHRLITCDEDAWAFAGEVGLPIVFKPQAGAAAVSTSRVTQPGELARVLEAARPTPQVPWVAEEFVTGQERSFETMTIRGVAVWDSSTRYDPPPLTVLENGWIQWTVLLPRETETADTLAIRPAAHKALAALGMVTGISHMEWFRRPDGTVAISEVAARPPGAQILALNSYAHDVDFVRLWAELAVFERFEAPLRRFAAGVAFFRAQGQGSRIVKVRGIEAAQKQVGHLVVEAKLPLPGQARSTSYEGEGYAIVRHPDTAVVESALRTLITNVQVEAG